jgi:hypothetical protein
MYQATLSLKHIINLEGIENTLRAKLLAMAVAQLEINNYELFFEVLYGFMR